MKTVFILNAEGMGRGDDALGQRILTTALSKVSGPFPGLEAIVFFNGGVKLLAEGSPVLPPLAGLHDAGVELVACGTCVDHFQLRDKLKVGRVSGMDEILRLLAAAEKVITL